MNFLTSWLREYVFQSALHSLVAACVVETLLRFWGERRPQIRLRFFLLTLWIPVFAFPVFQILAPARGSFIFRQQSAVFDLNAWLVLPLWNDLLLWHILIVVIAGIALMFFVQDLIPMVAPHFQKKIPPLEFKPESHPKLNLVWTRLTRNPASGSPELQLLSTKDPVLFSSGTRHTVVCLSGALAEQLDEEELEGVLAHELAHLKRHDPWIGWILVIFRLLILFNPVALIEFRRIIHEREKLCDDLAVGVTGKPLAIAAGLTKIFRFSEHRTDRRRDSFFHRLEMHSYRVHVEDRVARLVRNENRHTPLFPQVRLALTGIALLLLLFYVV